MKPVLIIAFALFSLTAIAQPQRKSVVIGSMTTRPNALLIVNPQNSDQGVLLPQLSSGQRKSMTPSSPQEDGLIVFDKSENAYYYWGNGSWQKMRAEGNTTKFSSIDPASFQGLKKPGGIRHDNIVIFENDNTFITASRDDQGEEMIAPVNLPHGSVLSEMTIYFLDNDDDNIRVRLLRKGLMGGVDELVSWESTGSSSTLSSVSLTNFGGRGVIDLERYSYRLVVAFDLDAGEEITTPTAARQRLYGVRLKYEE